MKRSFIIASGVAVTGLLAWYAFSPTPEKVLPTKTVKKAPAPKVKEKTLPPLVNDQPSGVHEAVSQILNTSLGYPKRHRHLMVMRRIQMTTTDEQALIDHLLLPQRDESWAIKNDILEHLIRYGSDQKKVGDMMLNLLNNEHQHQVMREYTLQYVPEYYQGRWSEGAQWTELDEDDRLKFNETMWNMSDLRVGSMAGGALFALHRLAEHYRDINADKVFHKAHDVLVDPSYANPNRMAAVQVLAFSKQEEFFETAKKIVFDPNGPTLLRVTAMHTAAQSAQHDQQFYRYLNELARGGKDTDPSLRRCAQLTLKKINDL